MIVLICCGRTFGDQKMLNRVMTEIVATYPAKIFVHGDAHGADRMAGIWATNNGYHVAKVPALWDQHKTGGGHRRNAAMLLLKPDLVVCFPGNAGTTGMAKLAHAAGVKTLMVEVTGELIPYEE